MHELQMTAPEPNVALEEIATLRAALAEAMRMEAELAEECADAWESAVDWGAYASEYFQEKWNLAADKERLTKACERVDAIRARNDQRGPAAQEDVNGF